MLEAWEIDGVLALTVSIIKNVDSDTAFRYLKIRDRRESNTWSERERQILRDLSKQGVKNKEIAEIMGYDSVTIRNQKAYLKRTGQAEHSKKRAKI